MSHGCPPWWPVRRYCVNRVFHGTEWRHRMTASERGQLRQIESSGHAGRRRDRDGRSEGSRQEWLRDRWHVWLCCHPRSWPTRVAEGSKLNPPAMATAVNPAPAVRTETCEGCNSGTMVPVE